MKQCQDCSTPIVGYYAKRCKKCSAIKREQERIRKIIRCKHCGKEFSRMGKKFRSMIFCSKKCKTEYCQIPCKNCGKLFTISPKRFDNNKTHTCSNKCKGELKTIGYYGPNWLSQSRKTKERDNYTCQICGIQKDKRALIVHHIIPFREFSLENYEEANDLSNLILLCRSCRHEVEKGIIAFSAITISAY